ncbi:MAG: SH3 domain-containing protein, partial [Chloroflexi bacterium]|nr:SH3 domain-containing protein [Chloroflexota bacterium]
MKGFVMSPPTLAFVGDINQFKITITNTWNQLLQAQEPHPGYVYLLGQSYLSQQFASEPGKWRVGISAAELDSTYLQYRWGLGDDLAPGATTTVTGQIKVVFTFEPTRFWSSLVREPTSGPSNRPPSVATGVMTTDTMMALPQNHHRATVAADVVNVHSAPSPASPVMARVKRGTELHLIGQWIRVDTHLQSQEVKRQVQLGLPVRLPFADWHKWSTHWFQVRLPDRREGWVLDDWIAI